MSTTKKFTSLVILVGILLGVSACQKKCQQPATEKFKTFVGQEWRLVETTDPSQEFKKLSNTTFLIFSFEPTYVGTVKKVLNNLQFDTPAKTFIYTVDPKAGLIRLRYQDPPTEEEADAGPTPADTQNLSTDPRSTVEYSYSLNRELELSDDKTGYYYRFVPFQGVINPDDTCEF